MKILRSPPASATKTLPLKSADITSYALPQMKVVDNLPDLDAKTQSSLIEALHLSFVIYDPLAHLETELQRLNFSHILKLDKRWSGTQGICGIKDRKAYLVFRGSASPLDWFYDFLCLPFYWPLCHFGFGTAWRSIRGTVRKWLQEIPEVDEFMICGHSLGGGISHMAALELAPNYKIDHVITFGAPKACFLWTAKKYNATRIKDSSKTLIDVTKAVVNQRDIVAKVPPGLLGFRDVGHLIYIDQKGIVHTGDKAVSARSDDSMSDIDFMFNFMEDEKISALGPASSDLQKLYYNLRQTIAWLAKTVPVFKIFILPSLSYILASLYFMRSGLAHMGDKYMSAWPGTLGAEQFRRYQQTKTEKAISLAIRLVSGGLLVTGFFWGLYHILALSIDSFSKKS